MDANQNLSFYVTGKVNEKNIVLKVEKDVQEY